MLGVPLWWRSLTSKMHEIWCTLYQFINDEISSESGCNQSRPKEYTMPLHQIPLHNSPPKFSLESKVRGSFSYLPQNGDSLILGAPVWWQRQISKVYKIEFIYWCINNEVSLGSRGELVEARGLHHVVAPHSSASPFSKINIGNFDDTGANSKYQKLDVIWEIPSGGGGEACAEDQIA